MTSYNLQFFAKTFRKPIDKFLGLCYNIVVVKNDTNQSGV